MGCCCGSNTKTAPSHTPQPVATAQAPAKGRYNGIGVSTTDPLLLIKGYEDERVGTLEEALQPFDGKITRLNDQIKEAKLKCHYPSEHHLTHDESAALYLYLTQDEGDTVANRLQKAWATNDREQMKPWFKYLKLLKSGLDKLPAAKVEVWQGAGYDKDVEANLQAKSVTLFTSMGLSCPSLQQVKNDLQGNPNSKKLLVGYQSVDGKDVTGYGPTNQKETFIWPGVKLTRGKQADKDPNGSVMYHLTGKKGTMQCDAHHQHFALKTFFCIVASREPLTLPEPEPQEPLEIHFVCQAEDCSNGCRGHHALGHCYGFERLFHKCNHHCGPTYKCAICKEEHANLCECKRCHKRFCDKCCFKKVYIEPRE